MQSAWLRFGYVINDRYIPVCEDLSSPFWALDCSEEFGGSRAFHFALEPKKSFIQKFFPIESLCFCFKAPPRKSRRIN